MRILVAVILALGLAQPAQAAWRKASSENFVIYANDSEADLVRFSQDLESYHQALEILTGTDLPAPSPSNRVTIFVVGNWHDVGKLYGARNVAGFYVPRAGASRAFIPNLRFRSREPDFSLTVLLHEYAHHFQAITSRVALPSWISEGSAEFYASAKFEKDGTLAIGRPANHQAFALLNAPRIPLEILLDYDNDENERARRGGDLHGRSWLLFHYLYFADDRSGQLREYGHALARGVRPRDAANDAFGDLGRLENELDTYLKRNKFQSLQIESAHFTPVPTEITELSEGHGKVMDYVIRSQRGVTREEALEIVPKVRAIAERYPDDPAVLAALAEAEHDAGFDRVAIAAADRALALDPENVNALVQKGLAQFRLSDEAPDAPDAYADAVRTFSQLNAFENDHPIPLIHYFRATMAREGRASETARAAIERAAQLAPFDHSLWLMVAAMQASEGKIALARQSLTPIAANPHEGLATVAQVMMKALDGQPEGEPLEIAQSPIDEDKTAD